MTTVIVFDRHARDWVALETCETEWQAETFVREYPRFGAEHSRTIREGNYQLIEEKG